MGFESDLVRTLCFDKILSRRCLSLLAKLVEKKVGEVLVYLHMYNELMLPSGNQTWRAGKFHFFRSCSH